MLKVILGVMIQLAVDQKSCSAVFCYISQTCSAGTRLTIFISPVWSYIQCFSLGSYLPSLSCLAYNLSPFIFDTINSSTAETHISVNRFRAKSNVPKDQEAPCDQLLQIGPLQRNGTINRKYDPQP